MTRGLDAAMVTALSAHDIRSEDFFKGVFDGTTLKLWTGYGSIVWNSETWDGNGKFIGLSSCSESIGGTSSGIAVEVSGVSEELIYLALNSCRQSSTGKVWRVYFNANEVAIGSIVIFSGTLDTVNINRSASSGTISLGYESRLIRFNESREIRLTNELQQEKYPGDKGFEYVNQLKGARIYWGRADPGRLRL